MRLKLVIFCCLMQLANNLILAANSSNSHYEEDAAIMKKCLTGKNGKIALIDLQRVSSFSQWNETEKVICFTYCLSTEKGWFDNSTGKWLRQQLEADLGQNLYRYCEYELERNYENVCDFVFKGFRCLREATNNTVESYKTFINCAIDLHANLEELQKYAAFASQEYVPCLFKCFAEKLSLYDDHYEWNKGNWIKAFGTVKGEMEDYSVCRASVEERANEDQKCEWMYQEYRCLELMSKKIRNDNNTMGEVSEEMFSMTTGEVSTEDAVTEEASGFASENVTVLEEVAAVVESAAQE